MKPQQPVNTNENKKVNPIEKTRSVKAFTIMEGDVIGNLINGKEGMYLQKHTVESVTELDKDFLTFNFKGGGFGVYGRRNYVNKVISKH